MEADVSINENTGVVTDMKEMTGIALGSSEINSPAFPGAVRLASIQCFDTEKKQKTSGDEGGQEMPTFEEVKAFVKSNHVYPHQLYGDNLDMMKSDKEFGKLYTENARLTKENEKLQKDFDEYKQKSEEAVKESQRSNSKALLKKLLPEGLTKKQIDFIEDDFDPDKIDDLSEKGISDFITASQGRFTKVAKIFGADTEKTDDEGSSDEDDDSTSSDDPVENAIKSIIPGA